MIAFLSDFSDFSVVLTSFYESRPSWSLLPIEIWLGTRI